MVDGVLEPDGSRWRLRFTRTLAHAPEKVWRALTEPDDLAAWFPDGISGTFEVGATLRFGSPQVGEFTGEVLAVDPPRVLEYTWGPDVLRFEVEPSADGCVLTLTDTLDDRGKGARDGAGWQVCLEDLYARLDDGRPGPDGRWRPLYADYTAAFGPAASTAEVPG